MTEYVTSPEVAEPHRYVFEQIQDDITILKPGDIVSFDTAEQFDGAVATAALYAMNMSDRVAVETEYYASLDDPKAYVGHAGDGRLGRAVQRPSSNLLLPESKFWGRYDNYSMAMLSGFRQVDEDNPRFYLAQALVSADLCYSGKGAVATQRRLLTMRSLRHGNGVLHTRYKDISGNTAKSLDLLRLESASSVHMIALKGLEHVILSGLPTLGKRR